MPNSKYGTNTGKRETIPRAEREQEEKIITRRTTGKGTYKKDTYVMKGTKQQSKNRQRTDKDKQKGTKAEKRHDRG